MTKTILKKKLKNEDYEWEYSNYGMAVLGAILGNAYKTTFQKEMQAFIHNDLHLKQTRWGDGKGDLDGYWEWNSGYVYLAADGIVSTIEDMMRYAQIQISESLPYLSCTYEQYVPLGPMGVNGAWIDGMGLGWILDQEQGIIWHNGGTGLFLTAGAGLGSPRDRKDSEDLEDTANIQNPVSYFMETGYNNGLLGMTYSMAYFPLKMKYQGDAPHETKNAFLYTIAGTAGYGILPSLIFITELGCS